jgi:hypothetical protein
MSNSGALTLGDVAGRGRVLEIECVACGPFGGYPVFRLIERQGENVGLPHRRRWSAPAPRHRSTTDASRDF